MGIDVTLWRARIGLFNGGRVPRSLKGLLASLLHRKCHTATPHRDKDKTDNPDKVCKETRPIKQRDRTARDDPNSQKSQTQTDLSSSDKMSCDQITRHYDSSTVSTLNKMVYTVLLFSLALLLIMAGDVEINPGPTGMDTVLNIEDLLTVCSQLHDASPQWFNLGLVLGLDHTTLTNLDLKYHDNSDQQLREMLAVRLQSGPLTWGDLCAALRNDNVDRKELAKTIEDSIEDPSVKGLTHPLTEQQPIAHEQLSSRAGLMEISQTAMLKYSLFEEARTVHSGASSAKPSKSKTSTGLAIVIWTTRSKPMVSTDELNKHTSAMAVTFRELGYIVVEEEAKDKDQFAAIISRERETIKSPDCPVVVVVSGEQYGQEINNLHCGHDKINISEDIVEPLLPAHLAKNPKIFFINTVQDHSISLYEALQAPHDDNFVVALSSSTAYTRHPLEYLQKELASNNDSLSEILEWIQDELPEEAVRVASHFKKPVFLHPVGPTERSTADSSSNKLSRRRRADKINSAIKFTPNSQGLAIVMEFVKKSGSSTTVAQTLGHHFNFAVVEESGIHTERKVKDIIYAAGHLVEYPSPDYPIVIAIFSHASWGDIHSMPCGSDKLSVSNLFTPLLPPSAPHLADNPKIFLINTCLPYPTHIRSDLSLPSTGNFLFALTSTPLNPNYISRSLSTNLLISRGRESIDKVLQRVKESNERFTMTVVSHLSNKPVYFKPVETSKIKTIGRLALFVNVSKSDSITHHTREPQRLVEARTFQELGFSVIEKDATELTDLANIYRRHLTGSPSPDCPVVVVLTLNGWVWSILDSFELTQPILDPLLPLHAPHLAHSPKIVIIQGDLRMSINMMRYESPDMPAEGNSLVCLINHHYENHDIDLNKELLTSCESIQDTLMWYEDENRYSEMIKVMSTLNQPVYLHPHGPPKSRTGQDPAVKATELTVARQRRADKINSAIKSSPKSCGLAIVLGVNGRRTDSTEIAKTFAETLNFAVVEEYNIQTTRKLTDIIYAASHLVEYPKTQDCPIVVFVMWDRAKGTIEALDCGDGTINISQDIIEPLIPPSAPHLADNPKIFIINTDTFKLKGTPTFKLPDSGNFVLCYTQFKDVHVIKQASEAFSKAFTQSSDSVDKVLERMEDDNPSLKMQVISHLNRPVYLLPGSSDLPTTDSNSLAIATHPVDCSCKPSEKAKLFIMISRKTCIYQWHFRDDPIPVTNSDYQGSTTDHLYIHNCLSKHEGPYKCVVTDPVTRESVTSREGNVKIDGGKLIKATERKLLMEILCRAKVDLSAYGIYIQDENSHLTYEEMQFVLGRNTTTQILSENLEAELVARIDEEMLYKEAMLNDHIISLTYTKILAMGPGQVGKSTFLYRLMGIMKGNIQTADPDTQPQCSTGITELHEACIRYTSMTGAVADGDWHVFDKGHEVQSQLKGLIALLRKQMNNQPEEVQPQLGEVANAVNKDNSTLRENQGNEKDTDTDKLSVSKQPKSISAAQEMEVSPHSEMQNQLVPADNVPHKPQKQNIAMVIEEFENLQQESLHSLTQDITTFNMLFNIADIGGQPAFLEMLPSLTIGPALYLIFMKLLDGLNTRYPTAFKCKDGRGTTLCQNYTYTSEEVIFTALSSIACFGNSDEEVEMYVTSKEDRKKTSSLALLIGTHADKIEDPHKLAAINDKLKQHIEETDFFTEGLIHSKELLKVNNYSAADEEILKHRKLLEGILTANFRRYNIPARWLMLSICLKILARNQGTHEVSFDDCIKIGKHFQMSSEMVKIALQFLHKYIGLVMYFPNHEHLKNIVICDPQAVFTSISELIFKIYDPANRQVKQAQQERFVQTGCFSPQDVKRGHRNVLSIDTVIDLLVHLNIAAEVTSSQDRSKLSGAANIHQQSANTPESPPKRREYMFPAVLQTVDNTTLSTLKIQRQICEEPLPEPICIRFKTGYMPLGFVCALTAKLLSETKLQVIFQEGHDMMTYKNLLKFRYDGEFDILMISGPKYCEFCVTRHTGEADFWSKDCCPQIKKTICDAADGVVRSMKHGSLYKLSKGYELAFKCTQHPKADIGHEPLARVVQEPTSQVPKKIQCVKSTCSTSTPLTPEMKMWFGEALAAVPLEVCTKQLNGNVLKITAKGGSKPLKFQWFKDEDEEPLTDSTSYSGSTTAELVIEGTDSELKGKYKCRVADRKENVMSSGEIEFDPFIAKLEKGGLRGEEIKKITGSGYQSMEDLQHFNVEDKEIDLNRAEKNRVTKFLEQAGIFTPKEGRQADLASAQKRQLESEGYIEPGTSTTLASPVNTTQNSESIPGVRVGISDFQSQSVESGKGACFTFPVDPWKLQQIHSKGLTGSGIKVAVLDTGVFLHHDKLKKRWQQFKHLNFIRDSKQRLPDETAVNFPSNHGTAVVSCLLQVAPEVTVYLMRVAHNHDSGWEMTCVLEALQYIIDMKDEERPDIVSMSFFVRSQGDSVYLEDKFIELAQKRTVCVAAVGNGGNYQKSIPYPAHLANVIAVGSLDGNGEPSRFNPKAIDGIQVYAPGEEIEAPCLPKDASDPYDLRNIRCDTVKNRTNICKGTSMATPMIAGLIALIFQHADQKMMDDFKCKDIRTNDMVRRILCDEMQDTVSSCVLEPWKYLLST